MSVRLTPISRNALIELEELFEQFQHFHQQYTCREWNSPTLSSPSLLSRSVNFSGSSASPSWRNHDVKFSSPTSLKVPSSTVSSSPTGFSSGRESSAEVDSATTSTTTSNNNSGSSSNFLPSSISAQTHLFPSRGEGHSPSCFYFQNGKDFRHHPHLLSESGENFSPDYHALLLSGGHPLLRGCFLDVMQDPYASRHWRLEDKLLYMLWWGFRPSACADCGLQDGWLPSRNGEYSCANCGVMAGSTKRNKIVEDSSSKFAPSSGGMWGNGGGSGFHTAGRGGGGGGFVGEGEGHSDEDEDGDEDGEGLGEKNTGVEEGEMKVRLVYSELFHWLQGIPVVVQRCSSSFSQTAEGGRREDSEAQRPQDPPLPPPPHTPCSSWTNGYLWCIPTGEDLPAVLRVAYDLTVLLTMPTCLAGTDTASLRSLTSYHLRSTTPAGANKIAAFTSNAFTARGCSLYLSLLLHRYWIPFSFFVRGAGRKNSNPTVGNVGNRTVMSHYPNSSEPPTWNSNSSSLSYSALENSAGRSATLEWVDIEFAAMLTGIPLIDFFGLPIMVHSKYPRTTITVPKRVPSIRGMVANSLQTRILSAPLSGVIESTEVKKTNEHVNGTAEDGRDFVFPPLLLQRLPSDTAVFFLPSTSPASKLFPSAAAQFMEHISSICYFSHYPLPSLFWNCFSFLPSLFNDVVEGVRHSRLPRHPMLPRPSTMNSSSGACGSEEQEIKGSFNERRTTEQKKRHGYFTAFSSFSCSTPVHSASTTMISLPPEYIGMGAMMTLAAEVDQYSLWSLGVKWVVENMKANKKTNQVTSTSPLPFYASATSVSPRIHCPTALSLGSSPLPRKETEGRESGGSEVFERSEDQKDESMEKKFEEAEKYVLSHPTLTEKAWEVAEFLGTQLAQWYRVCRMDNLYQVESVSSRSSSSGFNGNENTEVAQPLYSLEVLLYPSLEDFGGNREAWREALKISAVNRFQEWQLHFKIHSAPLVVGIGNSSRSTPLVEAILFTASPSANALLTIFTAVLEIPYHPLFLADLCTRTGLFGGPHRCGTVLEQIAQGGHYGLLPLVRRLSPLASMWVSPYLALHSIDRLPFLSALRLLHHSIHLSGKAQNVILQQLQRILVKYGGLCYYQFFFVIRVTDSKEKIFNGFYFLSAVYGGAVGIAVFSCMRSGRKTIAFNAHNKMISLCHYDERDFHLHGMHHNTPSSNIGSASASTSGGGIAPAHTERTVRSLQLHLIHGATPVVAGIDTSVTALLYDIAKSEEASRGKFYSWAVVVQMMEILSHLRRRLQTCNQASLIENDKEQRRRNGRGVDPTGRYLVELAAWQCKIPGGGGGSSVASSSCMPEISTERFQGSGDGGLGYTPSSGAGGEWGQTVDDLRQSAPFHLGHCRDVIQKELFALRRYPSFLFGLPDERVVVLYALVVAFLEFVTVKQAALQQQEDLVHPSRTDQPHHHPHSKGNGAGGGAEEEQGRKEAASHRYALISPPLRADQGSNPSMPSRSPLMQASRQLPPPPSTSPRLARGVSISPRSSVHLIRQGRTAEKETSSASTSHPRGNHRRRERKQSTEVVQSPPEIPCGVSKGVVEEDDDNDTDSEEAIGAGTVLNWVEELWWKEEEEEEEDEEDEEEDEENEEAENVDDSIKEEECRNESVLCSEPLLFSGFVNTYGEETGETDANYPSSKTAANLPLYSDPSPLRRPPPPQHLPISSRRSARATMTPVMHSLTPPSGLGKASFVSLPPLSLGSTTASVGPVTPPRSTEGETITGEGTLRQESRKKTSPLRHSVKLSPQLEQPTPPQQALRNDKSRRKVSPGTSRNNNINNSNSGGVASRHHTQHSSSIRLANSKEETIRQAIRCEYLSSIPSFKDVLEQPEEVVLSPLFAAMRKLRRAARRGRSAPGNAEKNNTHEVTEEEGEEEGKKGEQQHKRRKAKRRRTLSSSSSSSLKSPPISPLQTSVPKVIEKEIASFISPRPPGTIPSATINEDSLCNSSSGSASLKISSSDIIMKMDHPPLSRPHSSPSSGTALHSIAGRAGVPEKNCLTSDNTSELNLEAFCLFDAAACRSRICQLLHFLQVYDDLQFEVEMQIPHLAKKYLADKNDAHSLPQSGVGISSTTISIKKKMKHFMKAENEPNPHSSSLLSSALPRASRQATKPPRRENSSLLSLSPPESVHGAGKEEREKKEEEGRDATEGNPLIESNDKCDTEQELQSFPSLPPLLLPPSTKTVESHYPADRISPQSSEGQAERSSSISSTSTSSSEESMEKVGAAPPSAPLDGNPHEVHRERKITGRNRRRHRPEYHR